MLREPVVAGQFYPGSAPVLKSMIQDYLAGAPSPEPALMAISPHAGYPYSGALAGQVLSRIKIPKRVMVLGPNHRGLGESAAMMSKGSWSTPLGEVPLDQELGQALIQASRLVREDHLAHQYEHSLEVQIPFLQMLNPDFMLTPLCLSLLDLDQCLELGKAMAGVISSLGEPVLMVASSDMSHYEPAERAKERDMRAVDRILALDEKGLYNTVRSMGITMCGVIPATVCLAAAKELGASRAELVNYTNSGEASGDFSSVVGYAGLIIK